MKATPLEFRLRYLIHAILYTIGFTAPWNYALHLDSIRTWQYLAAWLARAGILSFSSSTWTVLVLGIVFAFLAAALRTWASACIGASVVQDSRLHAGNVVAAGPYRFLRNPLYLGTFLSTLAVALLMPPTGALFTLVTIGLFQLRLIAAEEPFLTARLGEAYLVYCARVPRLVPALIPRLPPSSGHRRWPAAFLVEIYFWGVFVSFATLGWSFNSIHILQGVVIGFGLSLVARAFIPKQ